MNQYIPLRVKSDHSILYGFGTINEYVKRCKELGIKAIGLTDRFNESGLHEFIKTCQKEGIKPIPGVELLVKVYDEELSFITLLAHNNNGLRNLFKLMEYSYKNKESFEDETSFITFEQLLSHKEGLICLTGYEETLISDYIKKGVFSEKKEEVTNYLNKLKETFKEDLYLTVKDSNDFNFKVGQSFDINVIPSHEVLFAYEEHKVPCDMCKAMGVNKMTMFETDNKHGGKRPVSEFKNALVRDNSEDGAFIKNDIYQLNDLDVDRFSNIYDNLNDIVNKTNVSLEFNTHLRPEFPIPDGMTNLEYLKELVNKGFDKKRKGSEYEEKSKTKIAEELDTIAGNDFVDYFLVVSEYCKFAKKEAGGIGLGRGSAGGSEVAYLLDIHDTDPIRHELLFERFLSPGRGSEYTIYYDDNTEETTMISDKHIVDNKQYYTHQLKEGMTLDNKKIKKVKLTRPSASAVDIDTDFHTSGRNLVYNHVKEFYGYEKVSQVITLGKFKKLQAVKSIGTIYNIPFIYMNKAGDILKDVESLDDLFNGEDTKERIEQLERFKFWTKTLGEYGEMIYEYAPILEGRIRQEGIHACAVLISKEELSNTVPMFISPRTGDLVAQWEYPLCESVGLLKMDFLGLDNVDMIKNALDNVNENYDVNLTKYDIINSTLDDKKTYELFSSGQTNAIFQYSSDGVKQFLKELKPDNFKDLYAVTALYRPGPMGMGAHQSYTKRKNGEERKVPFDNDKFLNTQVEEVLNETYGLIPFQETLMNLARVCCGFTPYETDKLRKATGKKIVDLLIELKPKFLEGIRKNVNTTKRNEIFEEVKNMNIENKKEYAEQLARQRFINDQDLESMWDMIIDFSKYSFNKSHSVSYALNAYLGMYLKAHYPEEFMAAALRQKADSKNDTSSSLNEIIYMGLNKKSPDVNISKEYTSSIIINDNGKNKDVIYYGFDIVPNVTFGKDIVEERKLNGKYTSVQDFAIRMNKRGLLNKTSFISLASAGAFDSLGESRKGIIDSFKNITKFVKDDISGKLPKTSGLFPDQTPANEIIIPNEDFDYLGKLHQENKDLGYFLTGHPLDNIREGDIDKTAFKIPMEEFIKKRFKFKEIKTAGMNSKGSNIGKFSVYPLVVYISDIEIRQRNDGFTIIKITVDTGVDEFLVFPGRSNGNKDLPLTSTGKLIEEGKIYKMLINYWDRNGRPNLSAIDIQEVKVDSKGRFKNLVEVDKYVKKGE